MKTKKKIEISKREIKFRGMRKDNDEWVYGYLAGEDLINTWDLSNDNVGKATTFQVISETVGQYTGLKDKYGKEIYEGDIIELDYHGISEVFFQNGGYKINGKLCVVGFGSQAERAEVIGNIFENPELLKTN